MSTYTDDVGLEVPMIGAPAEAPSVPVRKCAITDVFDQYFVELLKLAPKNLHIHGVILRQTGQLPPLEIESYEALKDWVEINCDKPVAKVAPNRASRRGNTAIEIDVDFSETEYGRARYSVSRSCTDTFPIDEDDLLETVTDAIDNDEDLDDIVRNIAEKINEDAYERCQPDLEHYGDYDYDDHDASDSDNSSTDFSASQIKQRVREWLRDNRPELLEQL